MSDATYDLQPFKAPRLAGFPLRAFARTLESDVGGALLVPKLFTDAGISAFRRVRLEHAPTVRPSLPIRGELAPEEEGPPPDLQALLDGAPAERPGFAFASAADYARAYRAKEVTPLDVARRYLTAVAEGEADAAPLRAVVHLAEADLLAQAEAATARFERGEPLGPLDGVPIGVKDELDQVPHPTTVGTTFLARGPATADATVVARLREAGALLVGKLNMHEIGIGTTGLNPHLGTARNPYGPAHHTGGSSSGCGAAVAAGLCPIAVGADAGGSIRTPASLCGVVGLKATYGRVSEHGAFPLCWSMGHVGPLGATVRDVALGYLAMAGVDPHDGATAGQPRPHCDGLGDADLSGVRLGIFRPWFEDAQPEVVAACQARVDHLVARGATVREVGVPDLELARVAHVLTIASEMATSMDPYYAAHRSDFGLDVRVNLALARRMTSRDYVSAQRARTRVLARWEEIFREVDLLVTPTTGRTAPPIAADALASGETDLATTGELMRYVFPANFTGYPAISFPAGYDAAGLPIGLQAIGRPWEEHLLLRVAEVAEAAVERRRPERHWDLLAT